MSPPFNSLPADRRDIDGINIPAHLSIGLFVDPDVGSQQSDGVIRREEVRGLAPSARELGAPQPIWRHLAR
ncbi:hypothetical protein N7462_002816 [Penicillium macrosclerotiorum]|uniref:uncharacterized protein n=1 Tax=Penicillium macrosclerotiorum TaxID=303699 RepID=UPI00254803F3|nr:uncharacterized protein N7462_002816 [Penicillium macrosclerotiorum]KAJ5693393.1 hypothetical protein N7462_002816 [Penicillium macrosclerotiorum]